ncbi:hypothetical protein AURDEDRAFT_123849 [Auricularia subglabra TFB-10046 SS5]|nr:hypothetical protein AURDEDRAFT_123849 [Auricularia subglabra TFB-10046 SS5]
MPVGCFPIFPLLRTIPPPSLAETWALVEKLIHLAGISAVWFPDPFGAGIFIDEHGEPTIGLEYDLCSVVGWADAGHRHELFRDVPPDALAGAGWWQDLRFLSVFDGEYELSCDSHMISVSDLGTPVPPNEAAKDYLMRADAAHDSRRGLPARVSRGCILLHLAMFRYTVNQMTQATYFAHGFSGAHDCCFLTRLEDHGDHVRHIEYQITIPQPRSLQVRGELGIVVAEEGPGCGVFDRDDVSELDGLDGSARKMLKWVERPALDDW